MNRLPIGRGPLGGRRKLSVFLNGGAVLLALCVWASPRPTLADTIDLGLAGQYAVFGLGSTNGIGSADTVTNDTAEIYGDVAVGADTGSLTASGSGSFQKGFIQGNLYVDGPITPAAYTIVNKNFTVSGSVFGTVPANPGPNPDSIGTGTFNLVPAVQDAIDRSNYYATLPAQTIVGNVAVGGGTQTFNAGVYSATSFGISQGGVLTIHGGPNDIFVFNDSGDFSFGKGTMQLTGGITSGNVLFNVTGTGTTATIAADSNSIFYGTLLADYRNIVVQDIGNGTAAGAADGGVEGRVIGALSTSSTTLDLIVHSGAEIDFAGNTNDTLPGVPEPSMIVSLLALSGCAIGGAVFTFRRRRVSELAA
jgi:hypothetical protein